MFAWVVISPAITTRPVLHSVSAATRDLGSCARMASSTASEIWSETLSGWPSETDSDVNRNSLFITGHPSVALARHFNKDRARGGPLVRLLFRLLAGLPLAANHALGAIAGRIVFACSRRY